MGVIFCIYILFATWCMEVLDSDQFYFLHMNVVQNNSENIIFTNFVVVKYSL